jgi:hypothetical protein
VRLLGITLSLIIVATGCHAGRNAIVADCVRDTVSRVEQNIRGAASATPTVTVLVKGIPAQVAADSAIGASVAIAPLTSMRYACDTSRLAWSCAPTGEVRAVLTVRRLGYWPLIDTIVVRPTHADTFIVGLRQQIHCLV